MRALLLLLVLSPAGWLSRANFDALDKRYRTSATARAADGATIAWGRSYALMAYVAMFRATGDTVYLERLLDEGRAIAALRDDRRKPPLVDAFRGRAMPAWSTGRYSGGKRRTWAVHTGMITAPVLEGLWLSKERDARLLKDMREAVDAHADEWRDGKEGEGHLGPLPYNQQNALGRSYVWLYRLTGEEEYRRRAKALLRYFKNRLRRDGGAYVWSYSGDAGFEDVSHAAINVDFACLGASCGWVFDARDRKRLRATLLDRVMKAGDPADTVGGGDAGGRYGRQVGRWLALAEGDAEVWNRVRGYFERHRPTTRASDLLVLAQLLRYRPR
jgi:hypothetical protein